MIKDFHYLRRPLNTYATSGLAYCQHLKLQPTVQVVRNGVVEESALLKIREVNRLRRPVEVFRRTLLIADRKPRASLSDTFSRLGILLAKVTYQPKALVLRLCIRALADSSMTGSGHSS